MNVFFKVLTVVVLVGCSSMKHWDPQHCKKCYESQPRERFRTMFDWHDFISGDEYDKIKYWLRAPDDLDMYLPPKPGYTGHWRHWQDGELTHTFYMADGLIDDSIEAGFHTYHFHKGVLDFFEYRRNDESGVGKVNCISPEGFLRTYLDSGKLEAIYLQGYEGGAWSFQVPVVVYNLKGIDRREEFGVIYDESKQIAVRSQR